MKNIWGFLCFVTLVIILLVDMSARFSNAQSDPVNKVVNAQEFNLVDKEGRKCASFFVNSTGEASIQLGPSKKPGFRLSVITPDGLDIYKSNGDGKGVSECWINADLGEMHDSKGKIVWSMPK